MARGIKRQQVQRALHSLFGLDALRPGQRQALHSLLAGRDLLCILPTGAGKSLCYQLSAVLMEGCTLVVSPLIALMNDQVHSLTARGIAAACLNSLQSPEERGSIMQAYRGGRLKLLYVAPERLTVPGFRQMLLACPPSMLVVDEAHCVVQWGRDFRPSYQQIGALVGGLTRRPVVCAMTATADRRMQKQLVKELGMRRPKRVVQPVYRPNLRYGRVLTEDKNRWLTQYFLNHPGEKGLVFCRTRKRAEALAACLDSRVGRCGFYHAGLERELRDGIQDDFIAGRLRLLCATSAFGMGVDVPDIRAVIHDEMPERLIDLAQQSGRGGRDGRSAECIVLVSPGDLHIAHKRIRTAGRGKCFPWLPVAREWRLIKPSIGWCFGRRCLADGLSRAFGQRVGHCGRCDVCRERAQGLLWQLPAAPCLRKMSMDDLAWWLKRYQHVMQNAN